MNRERNGKSRRDHGSYTSQNNTLSQPGMFCKSVSSHKGWLKTVYLISVRKNCNRKLLFFFRGKDCFILFCFVYLLVCNVLFYTPLLQGDQCVVLNPSRNISSGTWR